MLADFSDSSFSYFHSSNVLRLSVTHQAASWKFFVEIYLCVIRRTAKTGFPLSCNSRTNSCTCSSIVIPAEPL
jgi:hypothetical protein